MRIPCGHILWLLAASLCVLPVRGAYFGSDDLFSEGTKDSEDLLDHVGEQDLGAQTGPGPPGDQIDAETEITERLTRRSPSRDCPDTQVWDSCACMRQICGRDQVAACFGTCIPGCMCPPMKYLDQETQRCVDPWKCPFGACADNALFVDKSKLSCAHWAKAATACDRATEVGYTTAEQETLLTECKTSCGSCGKIFGVDEVIGPDFELFEFSAMVADSPNKFYVANYHMNEVRVYSRGSSNGPFPDKTRIGGSGRRGKGLDQLNARLSCGLAVHPSNEDLYIADWKNHRVVKWAREAATGTVVAGGNGMGHGLHQVKFPAGVAVHWETGDVFVSEYGNSRVTKWAPNSSSGVVVAGQPDAQFSRQLEGLWHPKGITLLGGYVYIADWGNSRVVKWPMDGSAAEGIHVAGANPVASPPPTFGAQGLHQLVQPTSVFVHDDGTVYVCDTGNHRIMRWDVGATEGVRVAGVDRAGNGRLQLSNPSAVWRDKASGYIYVVDSDNTRIVQWRELGQNTVLDIHGAKGGDASPKSAEPVKGGDDASDSVAATAQIPPDKEDKASIAKENIKEDEASGRPRRTIPDDEL